jgi:hypothetical protein
MEDSLTKLPLPSSSFSSPPHHHIIVFILAMQQELEKGIIFCETNKEIVTFDCINDFFKIHFLVNLVRYSLLVIVVVIRFSTIASYCGTEAVDLQRC